MIARIVFIQIKPGMKEDEEKFWNNEVVPVLKKQDGFFRVYRMMEPDSNEGVLVEFWENKEKEIAWRSSKEHRDTARNILTTANEMGINRTFEVVQEITPES